MFFPGSFEESINFFNLQAEKFEARFGKPCHDYRIAPVEYVERAFDEGMDIEGLIRLDWHLEKDVTFPKVLTLSVHGKDPEIGSWLVTTIVAPGGVTVIHADGRTERTPPTPCEQDSE